MEENKRINVSTVWKVLIFLHCALRIFFCVSMVNMMHHILGCMKHLPMQDVFIHFAETTRIKQISVAYIAQ